MAVALAATVATSGCKPETIEKPTPPNMLEVVAAFADPNGEFNEQSAEELLSFLSTGLLDLLAIGITDQLNRLIADVEANVDEGSEPEAEPQSEVDVGANTITIDGDAFVVLTRICDGWGDEPVADPANGNLAFNVNLSDTGVDPVVWATASKCRYVFEGSAIELDAGARSDVGDIRVFVGLVPSVDELSEAPLIVSLDLRAQIDALGSSVAVQFDVDFATQPSSDELAIRVPTSQGDLIAILSGSEQLIAVEAAGGRFVCDAVSATCTNEEGDAVSL